MYSEPYVAVWEGTVMIDAHQQETKHMLAFVQQAYWCSRTKMNSMTP